MSENLKNKVVAITGASSGIGEAIGRRLASLGCKVALAARREDRLLKLVGEIESAGGVAAAYRVDVTDRQQMKQFADQVAAKFGQLDVFINNAGLMPLSPLSADRVEDWEQMVNVNVLGVLYGISAALPHFQKQESGHLINVSSVAGHIVFSNGAVYCGTKFAVRAISEGFRMESGPNIRSTIISPGAVQSELTDHVPDRKLVEAFKPVLDTAIEADAIAQAVAFAIGQPKNVDVNEIIVRPTAQEL